MAEAQSCERDRARLALTTRILASLDVMCNPPAESLGAPHSLSKKFTEEAVRVRQVARWAHDAATALCLADRAASAQPSTSSAAFSPAFNPFPAANGDLRLWPGELPPPSPTLTAAAPPLPDAAAVAPETSRVAQRAASLAGLPVEVKALIIEQVCDLDREDFINGEDSDLDEEEEGEEEEEEEDERAPRGSPPVMSRAAGNSSVVNEDGTPRVDVDRSPRMDGPTLVKAALISKEFANLASPYLWKNVDLSAKAIPDLVIFLLEILPRHGHHVQILTVRHDSEADAADSAFAPRWLHTQSCSLRDVINTLILLLLPRVHVLDVDFVDRPTHPGALPRSEKSNLDDWAYKSPLFSEAIRYRGSDFSDVSLQVQTTGDEGFLGDFIKTLPNLERLAIDDGLGLAPTGRATLSSAVTSLPRLSTLSLCNMNFVDDNFVGIEWQSSLTVLALDDCSSISFSQFFKLVRHHAATLRVLDIICTPGDQNMRDTKKHLGPDKTLPFELPLLRTLVFGTDHSADFLHLFDRCSLEEVEIGWCPRISYAAFEAFITRHSKTLKTVVVQSGGMFSDAQKESFEVFCHAKGIMCSIEPDSEDDTDYSDDDPDDPEVFDWEDYEDEGFSDASEGFDDEGEDM